MPGKHWNAVLAARTPLGSLRRSPDPSRLGRAPSVCPRCLWDNVSRRSLAATACRDGRMQLQTAINVQGRIIHCAGCTMGRTPSPRRQGPRSTASFLPRCVDVRWRLKNQLFGRRKVHPERENPGYAYEKRAPGLRCYAPRMVNVALLMRSRPAIRWQTA